jgi:predicted anti-sigma-YlaC factor YlaD
MPSQITVPQVAHAVEDFMTAEECSSAMLDLAALSEGNLSETGRRRLSDHLRDCAPCRALFESLASDAGAAPHTEDHDLVSEIAIGKSAASPARTNRSE